MDSKSNKNLTSKINAPKYESFRSALGKIAFYTYGLPGTLPVLAALNEKMDFYPTLERFVLGYKRIVFILSDKISSIITLDWAQANVLIFELYILSHLLMAYFRNREEGRNIIWGILSPLYILISAGALDIFSRLRFSEGLVNATFQIIMPAVLLLMFVIFIYRNFLLLKENGNVFIMVVAAVVLAIFIAQSLYHIDYIYYSPFGGVSNILFSYLSQVLIMISACIFGVLRIRGPAIVGLWFTGIFSAHWIGEIGLPALNRLADSIGI